MYMIVQKIFSKRGWPLLVYMAMNVLITAFLVHFICTSAEKQYSYLTCTGIAIILYLMIVVIDLSPIGEFILRVRAGGRKIKVREYINYVTPIFDEVYSKAKKVNPSLEDDIKLYMYRGDDYNAFAIGRRSICISEGLLKLSPEQIKGILGHEMGHLSNQDTAVSLLIAGGDVIISTVINGAILFLTMIQIVTGVGTITRKRGKEDRDSWLAVIVNTVLMGVLNLFSRIWISVGIILVRPFMRYEEYQADIFSVKLGYGEGLLNFFEIHGDKNPSGILGTLCATHPSDEKRVCAIKSFVENENNADSLKKDNALSGEFFMENEYVVNDENDVSSVEFFSENEDAVNNENDIPSESSLLECENTADNDDFNEDIKKMILRGVAITILIILCSPFILGFIGVILGYLL